MTFIPAANIVVSYDAEAMIAFQEHESLEAFTEATKGNDRIKIFNNAPNSTFISLKHSIGMSDGSKGTTLSLEFVDPEGLFEDKLLSNGADALKAPRNNVLAESIKKKIAFIEAAKAKINKTTHNDYIAAARQSGSGDSPAELLDRMAQDNLFLEDAIEKAEQEQEDLEDLQEDEGLKTEKQLLQLQLDSQTSELQKPVYIAYGVGTNLVDWSPAQCFEKVHKVEYNFDGTGARSIKLIYTAIGIHPNLTQMGISPLGVLGLGTVTSGKSLPIFNVKTRDAKIELLNKAEAQNGLPEGQEAEDEGKGQTLAQLLNKEDYAAGQAGSNPVEQAVGAFWYPSIHMMVKEAMTQYIQNGTNYENVIVLTPDLDKLLGAYLYSCWDEVVDGMPWGAPGIGGVFNVVAEIITLGAAGTSLLSEDQENIAGFAMIRSALEGLGLQFSESRAFPDGSTVVGPTGENVWESLEECPDPADAFKWLETRAFCAVCQCDNVTTTFQKKLQQVGRKISKCIGDHNEFAPEFVTHLQVETDLNMLKLFHEAGFIKTENWKKPTIIWGDRSTIMNFLEARIMEQSLRKFGSEGKEVTMDEQVAHEMSLTLHTSDILLGLNEKYLQSVIDYQLPIAWIGPFGPTGVMGGDDDFFLEDDTNLMTAGGAQGMEDLKKSQPVKANRMPVFSFGTKNPNILDIDIDINTQYMDLINNSNPATIPAQQMATAIIPKQYRSMATTMFASIENLNVDDIDENILHKTGERIPKGFLPLVEPFFEAETFSDDDVDMGAEWEEIFENLGPEEYKGLNDAMFGGKSFSGENTKEQFFVFMWQAFKDLMMQVHVPKSEQQTGGKNASKTVQAKMAQSAARMAAQALQGSIKTLPFFNLSTTRRAIRRSCLLYCIEPRFFIADKGGIEAGHTTWFSGIYDILGFEHNIGVGMVDSKFRIARSPLRGGQIVKD